MKPTKVKEILTHIIRLYQMIHMIYCKIHQRTLQGIENYN